MTATDPTSIDERNKIRCPVCAHPWPEHPAGVICIRHRPAPPRVRKRVRVPVERGLEPVPGMRVFVRYREELGTYTIAKVNSTHLDVLIRFPSGGTAPDTRLIARWKSQFASTLKEGNIVAVTVPNPEVSTHA